MYKREDKRTIVTGREEGLEGGFGCWQLSRFGGEMLRETPV